MPEMHDGARHVGKRGHSDRLDVAGQGNGPPDITAPGTSRKPTGCGRSNNRASSKTFVPFLDAFRCQMCWGNRPKFGLGTIANEPALN